MTNAASKSPTVKDMTHIIVQSVTYGLKNNAMGLIGQMMDPHVNIVTIAQKDHYHMPCVCPKCPMFDCYPEIRYIGDRPDTPPKQPVLAPAAKSQRPPTARSRRNMQQEAYMIMIAARQLKSAEEP